MRVNRMKAVSFEVEAFMPCKDSKDLTPVGSGTFDNEAEAVMLMAKFKAAEFGVICIARNGRGEGATYLLGLVKA